MKKHTLLFICCVLTISLFAQSQAAKDNRIQNIICFSKLYGYVRYFYPGDEAAKLNFTKFAIYSLPKVERAKNKHELKSILDSLFLPIAPGIKIYTDDKPEKFQLSSILPKDLTDTKIISWQHLGYGLVPNPVYKDMRTNRNTAGNETFGNLITSLDAKKYRGKKIKLRAAVKVDVIGKQGNGHLWVRVDREDKNKRGFFNNMSNKPIVFNEWKYYEIEGIVDEDAKSIMFGGFLSGKGELWIDDIKFFVQNEKQEWEIKDSLDGNFEGIYLNDLPQEWHCLNKSYQAVITHTTSHVGKKSVLVCEKQTLFSERTHIGDHIDKPIGGGLNVILPLALPGDYEHTFPLPNKSDYYALSGAVENEIPGKFDMKDTYVKLASAISFWNVFQHFYPYFNEVKVDWEAQLERLLTESIADQDGINFLHTLEKYQALLQDGHGYIKFNEDLSYKGLLPFNWEWIENSLVITDVFDSKIDLKKGEIISSINGVVSKHYIDSVMTFVSGATYNYKLRRTTQKILTGDTSSTLDLTLSSGKNETKKISVKRSHLWKNQISNLKKVNNDSLKKIDSKIYYVNINNICSKTLDNAMPELAEANCIIFDFRGYPYNLDSDFIRHLLTKNDTDNKWMQIPKIIYPDHEHVTYQYSGWNLKPKEPHIKAKIIVITDSRAISAAESYLSYFEGYKLGIIIGEATAGTSGNVDPITLSGIYQISWTGMHVVKHDGSQHHGVGIIPDVRLEKTIKGVTEGRDEFLEKAIEMARSK